MTIAFKYIARKWLMQSIFDAALYILYTLLDILAIREIGNDNDLGNCNKSF